MPVKPSHAFTAVLVLGTTLATSALADTARVWNRNDSGRFTFRAAIEAANANPSIDTILFRPFFRAIELKSPVEYTGSQDLTIIGRGATITDDGAGDLLIASGGGDLHLAHIRFVDAGRNGVTVNVPGGSTLREQSVTLSGVVLDGNGQYGLLFDDQSGGDGTGSDSAASLRLVVRESVVTSNNNPAIEPVAADKDGIRVDEGGEGDVTAVIIDSILDGNAAEGIEIDETGNGDVVVNVSASSFSFNGDQPQLPSDLEAGPGDIWVSLLNTVINGNQDEGLDLDEADAGDVFLTAVSFDSSGNLDENVKVTQLQGDPANPEGQIVARFSAATVNGSIDGDGIKLEAFDNEDDEGLVGRIFATIQNADVTGNDSDDIQLEAATGALVLRNTTVDAIDLTPGITQTILP